MNRDFGRRQFIRSCGLFALGAISPGLANRLSEPVARNTVVPTNAHSKPMVRSGWILRDDDR
jgi:hypothetical protein